MNKSKVEFLLGEQEYTLETGVLAKQALSSVTVRSGETVILVTVCAASSQGAVKGFLPLTVEARKRAYADGGIPGGYFKRESRLTEAEILASRAIDRSIRPCFPKNFYDELQVLATVMSLEPGQLSDVPALIGASAALHLAGLPFQGPVAATRVGLTDNQFVINPKQDVLDNSQLDMLVSGTEDAVLMVEAGAQELSEAQMLDAVMLAHQSMQPAIAAIKQLSEQIASRQWDWVKPEQLSEDFAEQIANEVRPGLIDAYQIKEKQARYTAIKAAKSTVLSAWLEKADQIGLQDVNAGVTGAINQCERDLVRSQMFETKVRIDGRDNKTVRPITTEVGLLPRAHGSALFTRGETQALVSLTLGGERDAQMLDGGGKETFMLHYNFPPFCVGEVGFMGAPKRREIGHGNLAKRALQSMLPSEEDCPFVIRLVSEVLESNGSSSMASVCGGSMALLHAGIGLKAPVAGIAMGLMKSNDDYMILSDILGDEDHLGDMDFKVAGTERGITALQMDIKVSGLSQSILEEALAQAREGRLHILSEMSKTIGAPNQSMSPYAPQMKTIHINPDRIRDVIGRGGATIREITETFSVEIDISDEGLVKICAQDAKGLQDAIAKIESLTAEIEVGKIYTGKVVKIMDFGAFVSILPGKDGFLHISQISHERVENISDYLTEGQEVVVKALELDKQGRIRVSMKAVNTEVAG